MSFVIVFIAAIAAFELCKSVWLLWTLLRDPNALSEDDDASVAQRQEATDSKPVQ